MNTYLIKKINYIVNRMNPYLFLFIKNHFAESESRRQYVILLCCREKTEIKNYEKQIIDDRVVSVFVGRNGGIQIQNWLLDGMSVKIRGKFNH